MNDFSFYYPYPITRTWVEVTLGFDERKLRRSAKAGWPKMSEKSSETNINSRSYNTIDLRANSKHYITISNVWNEMYVATMQ